MKTLKINKSDQHKTYTLVIFAPIVEIEVLCLLWNFTDFYNSVCQHLYKNIAHTYGLSFHLTQECWFYLVPLKIHQTIKYC